MRSIPATRLATVATLVTVMLVAVMPAPQAHAADAPPLLVTPAWLSARLGEGAIRIVDVGSAESYARGHVPGAVRLDLGALVIPVPGAGARLPTLVEAAKLLGALGIAPDTPVVAYDDAGGVNAARLFFLLDVDGHARAALLDGGIEAWRRAGLPVTTEAPSRPSVSLAPAAARSRVVTADWIAARLGDARLALVDARTAKEFSGEDLRARRGGHIPGAINVDWREHLRPDGTLKPLDELRRLYAARGVTPDKTVVTYCQSQHRGAHTYFVLRLLGYPRVLGYERSWGEWGNREDLPIAR